MDDNKNKNEEDKSKVEKHPLPTCTTAPSAEHARGREDDEPCDDGRKGETD